MSQDKINEKLLLLPGKPGIYQFFDLKGKIIYVGKAKNLKKRVTSYFAKDNSDSRKTQVLVSKITDIQYFVVDTEKDALLLENNLIKKLQPRYNILLKDDKTFPWICIKNENFPRIFYTRKFIKDKSQYFGPYTSLFLVRTILEQIKQLYKIRSCKLNLTQKNISENKFKVCLEYHIKNCKAPCVAYQTEQDYNSDIAEIADILKGNVGDIIKSLTTLMNSYSSEYKFELAQAIKEKIEQLEKYQNKSTIVSNTINNVDVFSIINDDTSAYVNYLKVSKGSIIQAHNVEIKKRIDETQEDLLTFVISDILSKFSSNPSEIIVPFELDEKLFDAKIVVPQIGDKKKLLELSQRNAKYYRNDCLIIQEKAFSKDNNLRFLENVKTDLFLNAIPFHIECFDNSNLQGTNAVASCVVFKNGKPSKNDYRHFNIKTVEQIDDFASMREIITRRYTRLVEEGLDLPQLIVVDGGKGQLSSAVQVLKEMNLYGKIAIIGLAKRLEEVFFPEDTNAYYLNKKSETLKLLQNLRNEAHRFGITFHRQKRSKSFIVSELDNITGIGDKTKQILFENFKSVENIKKQSLENLTQVVGNAKAKILVDYFQK